jgi:hypothetical protein
MSEYLPPQSPPVDRTSCQCCEAPDDVSHRATVRTADGQVMTVAAAVAAAVRTQRNTCPAESPSGICLQVRG